MFAADERELRELVRQEVLRDLAEIEAQIQHNAGSYRYLCNIAGGPVFTHQPVGPVIRAITPRLL